MDWEGIFGNLSPASFFNFSFMGEYGTYILQAVGYTLLLAVCSVLLAVVPALLLAIMRLSKNKLVKGISGAYIAIFRSTPLLVQLSIIYFGLFGAVRIPNSWQLFGFIPMSRFIPGVVALALNSSAYVAEIFRGGILAVDIGQTEAARSLGLSSWASMQLVVLPQDQERSSSPGQRNRHHGEGVVDLLNAGYGGADVRRENRRGSDLYHACALYGRGSDLLWHQLSGLQGHRGNRKEDAPWRQTLNSSASWM